MHNQPTADEIRTVRFATYGVLPYVTLIYFFLWDILAGLGVSTGVPHSDRVDLIMGIVGAVAIVALYFRLLGVAARSSGYAVRQLLGWKTPGPAKEVLQQDAAEPWPRCTRDAPLTLAFAIVWFAVVGPLVWLGVRFYHSL